MSDDTLKIKRRLSTLASSLDELEAGLAALLSQSLPELVLGLDTIQQAKLQVVIPYLVYDLVFVYLKTKGLDPKTHPVIAELDRVRQYFDKIKDAEDPAKRQFAIDRAAANRFIKHAIAQAKDIPPTPASDSGPATTRIPSKVDGTADTVPAPVPAPVKVTAKMLEREQYQRALREEEYEEEESGDLKVIDGEEVADGDEPSEDDSPGQVPAVSLSAKGKSVVSPSETSIGKRRRPPIDPFAGYNPSAPVAETSTTSGSLRSPGMARTDIEGGSADPPNGANTPSGRDFMRDEDFATSYESLLSLAATNGEVRPRHAPDHSVLPSETSNGKRRQPPIDPSAGYDPSAPVAETSITSSPSRSRRMARTNIDHGSADTPSGTNTASSRGQSRAERSRKRSKMKDPSSS